MRFILEQREAIDTEYNPNDWEMDLDPHGGDYFDFDPMYFES